MPNEQKTPLTRTLPALATRAALIEIQKRGTPLPGRVVAVTGPIVTVAFDVANLTMPRVQMPIFGPEYIRYPVQVGDKGVAFPMPVYIGNVSGLGPDVPANIDQLQGNLSLMWFPCGNKNWTASPNANATVIYGKAGGVIIIDTIGGSVQMEVTSTGITITGGNLTIGPNTTIDSHLFLTHTHSGVQTGTGVTGPVV